LKAAHSLRQRGTLNNRASFFAQPGEKPGALWATKEEKYALPKACKLATA
jgi:hypothetical protein